MGCPITCCHVHGTKIKPYHLLAPAFLPPFAFVVAAPPSPPMSSSAAPAPAAEGDDAARLRDPAPADTGSDDDAPAPDPAALCPDPVGTSGPLVRASSKALLIISVILTRESHPCLNASVALVSSLVCKRRLIRCSDGCGIEYPQNCTAGLQMRIGSGQRNGMVSCGTSGTTSADDGLKSDAGHSLPH